MKKYNPMLAATCLAGFIGLELSRLPLSFFAGPLGSSAVAAYAIGNSIINLATLAIAIIALIAVFIPHQALTVAACAVELVLALLCVAVPGQLLMIFQADESVIYQGIAFLQLSGIIMLVVTAINIPIRFIMHQMDFRLFLVIIAAGVVVSALLPWLFALILGMGVRGLAFCNISQPLACLVPMILMNSRKNLGAEGVSPAAGSPAPSHHPYLDAYKKQMRGE